MVPGEPSSKPATVFWSSFIGPSGSWGNIREALLAISGEQGSAKTVLSKLLRALVDPNVAPVRALPREEREMMIAANNGHLLAFDNLSGLPAWHSDALCRIASGGSFAVRQVYTDDAEALSDEARKELIVLTLLAAATLNIPTRGRSRPAPDIPPPMTKWFT
jgi:hypothetical protein